MELLKVDSLEEALEKLEKNSKSIEIEKELVPLEQSFGRTLAEDVTADENIPGFCRSVMDGYAVHAADLQGAGESIPAFLETVGEVKMGQAAEFEIEPGQCAYVPTGGMLPKGADAVVMEEYCEKLPGGKIAVSKSEAAGSNVALEDEDVAKGEKILKRGRRIKPQDMGLLAAAGKARVLVYKPLKIFIVSTGDEIIRPQDETEPGKVRDVNTYGLMGMALDLGFEVVGRAKAGDDLKELEAIICSAKATADVIAISGGSSKGKKDLTAEAIDRMASSGVFTHGIAVKPGKPTILAVDEPSRTVIAGLPGHPTAALMLFDLIAGGLWRQKTGAENRRCVSAEISVNMASSPGRKTFQLVKIVPCQSGGNIAQPIPGKSGMIYAMSKADGYIVIEKNREGLKRGETVKVYLM